MDINRVAITPVILGDPVWRLLPWLGKPFTGHLGRQEKGAVELSHEELQKEWSVRWEG